MTEKAELTLTNYDFYIPPKYRGNKAVELPPHKYEDPANPTVLLQVPKRARLLIVHPVYDDEELETDSGNNDETWSQLLYYCSARGLNVSTKQLFREIVTFRLMARLGNIFPPTSLLLGFQHKHGIKDKLVEIICPQNLEQDSETEHQGKFCLCAACMRTDHCESDPDIGAGHCGECVGPVTECDAPEETEEDEEES